MTSSKTNICQKKKTKKKQKKLFAKKKKKTKQKHRLEKLAGTKEDLDKTWKNLKVFNDKNN